MPCARRAEAETQSRASVEIPSRREAASQRALGLIVLMGAVVGLSYFVLWALFYERSLDELTKVGPLFYGAAALFAPYAVNQIRSAVTGLASVQKAQASTQSVTH